MLALPLSAGAAVQFWDVTPTRYAEAYTYLSQKGVVEGYADASGRPNQLLSRSEAVKILVELHPRYRQRALWFSSHMPSIPLFWDVDQSAWYGPYVETAFEAGLITGYPDRSLRPGSVLSAEEGITMLLRSYGMVSASASGDDPWYADAVSTAFQRHILS